MATFTLELEPEAFWEMVTKDRLPVSGPSAGFMWTGRQGKNGWENYKTRAQPIGWLYQATRIATMAGGAGAEAFRVNITVPSGTVARFVASYMIGVASAAATLQIWLNDEDGAPMGRLADVAAGASRTSSLPAPGGVSSATGNTTSTIGLMVGPGQTLSYRSSVAANAETITISITLLMSTPTEPTWNLTGSGGTPTLGASSISTANTLQAVYL